MPSRLKSHLPCSLVVTCIVGGLWIAGVEPAFPQEQNPAEPPAASADVATTAPASQPPAETPSASAPENKDDEPDKSIFDYGAIGLMREGGWFMWPILLLGVLAGGVIIERYRSLKLLGTDTAAIRRQVRELLARDEVEEALGVCEREQGPVPAILSAGLRKFLLLKRLDYDPGRIEEQVVKAMDDYSVHIVAALERHLPILATVSSAAPMLGFLGTVSGMINSFNDITAGMKQGINIVEAAAAGISEALLTTCFGLLVGIPAYVAFNYFSSVINRFVLDVEESATELIEVVTLQMALEQQSEGAAETLAEARLP